MKELVIAADFGSSGAESTSPAASVAVAARGDGLGMGWRSGGDRPRLKNGKAAFARPSDGA